MNFYNLFIAAGNAVFLLGMTLRSPKMRISRQHGLALALFCLFTALVGARITYIAIHGVPWGEGLSPWSAHRGGFSFIGAILGASGGLIIFARSLRLPAVFCAGETVQVWCLSSILWRMRCHFAGCCHGGASADELIRRFAIMSGSGSPGSFPLPALEILFLAVLFLWLGPIISFLVARQAGRYEEYWQKVRVLTYIAGYFIYRAVCSILPHLS